MELAVHQVRYGRSPFVRNSRFGPPTAPVAAYQPIASHEPGDPLAAAVDASVTQLIEHPRHPIGVATQLVDLSDRAEQLPVGQLPVGRCRLRHAQKPLVETSSTLQSLATRWWARSRSTN